MENPKILLILVLAFVINQTQIYATEEAPAYRLVMPEETYEYFKEDVFQGAKRIDWFDFEMGVKYQLNKTAVNIQCSY